MDARHRALVEHWSATIDNVNLPTNMTDEKQYSTLRYLPRQVLLHPARHCRQLLLDPCCILVRPSVRFHVIVDNYEGVEIVIDIPQKYPWFEEMYIEAMRHS